MTDEERRIITAFVERVSGANGARPASPWGALGGQQAQQPLPPLDPEADRLIADLMARHPEARYRLTQMAFVQEAALVEMQNRIQQLEWEAENANRQAQAAQSRTGLSGLFGGGSRPAPMPPRPQPQYPPGYNPGMMQRGGPGFLGTAMMTAAGVAGGLLLGNAIMGALGGGSAQAATSGAFGQDAVPASTDYAGGQDAAAYDQGYGADDAGAYDDGGGYDEEI
ncbi:DUF2076 domain-containing protein [Falsiroseomonas oryziterrae]|uniref:DUF2076 domain-containing protein n=1 Tax=Falsiroseomonas oryziterrae TaxID=2911368 RepID=UPI001F1FB81E|nr:DUF2076 family protein [Roseomonas sp. NPKOSM-4]